MAEKCISPKIACEERNNANLPDLKDQPEKVIDDK